MGKKRSSLGALQVGHGSPAGFHQLVRLDTEHVVPRSRGRPHLVVLQQVRVDEHPQLLCVPEGRHAASGFGNQRAERSNDQVLRRSLARMLRTLDLSDNVVAARVVAIQQAAYRVEADLIGFDGIPQLHESVDNLPLHQLQWMGSWEGNALVGFVAWCASADQCEIDRLAVHPDFHRRGHGRSLVGSLLTHRVVIVSTGTANIPGLGLYESLGFRRVGVREVAPAVTVTELHWLQPT